MKKDSRAPGWLGSGDDLTRHVPVQVLATLCNSFESHCWRGLESPITREEVRAVLDGPAKNLRHFNYGLSRPNASEALRAWHVGRVAYLAALGWDDPIDIDVGAPSLGCHIGWFIQDGNHRFAAAIIRGDVTILASLSGAIDYMRELGLLR